ncbi:Methyltransferase domain-containing protein [Desulfonatronum thiosulfatophilum]|uniref:Methyltransferase domain-containing protein n=1 Tax=Desulfonatronum thiosulfatophilum TaxID=617002 RepID=A0A1G6DBJ8_9BACT|nr:class I SAM-dependent methyltransferase [Desulfonatronum thiosulfatophilum]SDB42502.1 Methyltransferase domain-containing protein [Desulfonatronum thiosulfatophilum]
MPNTTEHWNKIFAAKADPELGWYEGDASQTLRFLEGIPHLESATVFLPGAGTSVLVDELLNRCHQLVLNDISDAALNKLKDRIQDNGKVVWLYHDMSKPLPKDCPLADLWIDRAVLHFLLEEPEIEGYFDNLRAVIKDGGFVLLAEFSPDGAPRCAGLDLHRYSAEEMAYRLGSQFTLIRQERFNYISPFGDQRPYIYALFQRRNSD